MSKAKEITFLIVNFNSSDFIKINLYSIFKLTKNKPKVLIVDNGSSKKDYLKLKKIVSGYKNVFLERFETDLRGSVAHGTALNYLAKRVKTPYFSILDADALWLKKDWDEILINMMDKKVCVIGTQAPEPKPQDFPLMFTILFRTEEFKKLNIDFRPQDIAKHKDTGWEIREKYLSAGLVGVNLDLFDTCKFKEGPFSELITSEYYLQKEKHIFASHFGRGSSFGQAKYKKSARFIMKIPGLRSYLAKLVGKREKARWIEICKEIIDNQSLEGVEFENVACDFCESKKHQKVVSAKDHYNELPGNFHAVKCNDCGLVFTNPRPTRENMDFYYPDSAGYFKPKKNLELAPFKKRMLNNILTSIFDYPGGRKESILAGVLSKISYFLKRNKLLSEGMPCFVKNGKLLDIGCSTGKYLSKMKDLGWSVVGIEPNKKAADFGRKEFGLDIRNINLDLFESKERFDVITLRMVLEHMHSPQKTISLIDRNLKEDGQVIIIVPNFSGFESRLFKRFAYTLQLPTHLFHFTPKTIHMYLEKSGFKVNRMVCHRNNKDFIAPFLYMKKEYKVGGILHSFLSCALVKRFFVSPLIFTMSNLNRTSRMTIYASRKTS